MKIIHVVGARPNFMKIAPLLQALNRQAGVKNFLLHTGQHYDAEMSRVFFEDLGLPQPDLNLEVGSGTHAEQTAQIMLRFEPVLEAQQPDLVLVVGDVNSTLACSLVAAKRHVPVAHVEAGVRSFDRRMPEEVNRVLTDALADWLFTPSEDAGENLLREGVAPQKIHFVGNVMVDALLQAVEKARKRMTWEKWGHAPGEYAVLTLHRPSNVDDPAILAGLVRTLAEVARLVPILFPLHPRTAKSLAKFELLDSLKTVSGIQVLPPQSYLDFLCLLSGARVVLTDSGGMQAETSMLGVPCLTLRESTEWPITITQGTNRLVGIDRDRIIRGIERISTGKPASAVAPKYWDGQAAQRIARVLLAAFD